MVFNISACRFENNKTAALLYGSTYSGSSSVDRNIFINNQGALDLNGIYSDIYFRNNIYKNNGGQIYFENGKNVITGNVFQDNYYGDPYDFFGNDYAGIVRIEYTGESPLIIVNNSFLNNRATALVMWSANAYNIENNIFHDNYPLDTSFDLESEYLNTAGRTFQYNLLNELVSGAGNRAGNPRLSNAKEGFLLSANSQAIGNGTSAHSSYLLPTDLLGNQRIIGQVDMGAVEFISSYVALTGINISDTVVAITNVDEEVARFTTTSEFDLGMITYTLADENGLNNNYFSIDGDKLILKKEITTEKLLRIKVRAEHLSGAWVDDYYLLTIAPTIVGVEHSTRTTKRVFPIPTDKYLYIGENVTGMTYSIYSVSGAKIQSGSFEENAIEVSELNDGLYILQLSAGNRVDRIKFYKHAR